MKLLNLKFKACYRKKLKKEREKKQWEGRTEEGNVVFLEFLPTNNIDLLRNNFKNLKDLFNALVRKYECGNTCIPFGKSQ